MDELYRLARIACRSWRRDRDHEDLVQTAVLYGWQHPELSSATMVWRMRARCIDTLRARSSSIEREQRCATPDRVDADCLPVSLLNGLSGRDAVVADMLAEGYSKCVVAAAVGVSPSRVSQLLSRWR